MMTDLKWRDCMVMSGGKRIISRIEDANGIVTPRNCMFSLIGPNNVTNTVIEAVSGINGSGWNAAKMEIFYKVLICLRRP